MNHIEPKNSLNLTHSKEKACFFLDLLCFSLVFEEKRKIYLTLPRKNIVFMMNQNGGFLEQIPVVTKNLIIINLLFWVASLALPKAGIDLVNILGLHFVGAEDFYPFQIITYMFMHDTHSFAHVFFNMFAVWMFGRVLEQVWGPKRFLTYYLVCGIGAGVIQELVQFIEYTMVWSNYESVNTGLDIIPMSVFLNELTTVGASGAVYGILLAFGMLFPNSQMFVFPIPVPIKAKYFVIGYAALELVLGITGGDGVAHFAHLGGMLFGLIFIIYWRKKNGGGQIYY